MNMDGEALKKHGFGSEITSDPSYTPMNTAVLSQWGKFIGF